MKYLYDRLKKRHSKMFYGIVGSYILAILLPILIFCITWYGLMNNLDADVKKVHQAILKQVRIAIDSQLTNVERVSEQVSINPYVMQLLSANQPINTDINYHMREIIANLSNINSVNASIIDDCYIYFRKPNLILNTSTKLSPELFYGYVLNYKNKDYDMWMNDILNNEQSLLYLQETVVSQSVAKESIVIAKNLNNGTAARGRLIIHINKDYFGKLIDDIKEISGSLVFVTDSDNHILFTNAKQNDIIDLYDDNKESVVYNSEKWSVEEIRSTSSIYGLRYIIFTPESSLMVKVNRMRINIFLSVVAIVLIGGFLAAFFAKRNYKPVRDIIKNIEENNPIKFSKGEEYSYIMESIRSMQEENSDMLKKLGTQSEIVKERLLFGLLKGYTEDITVGNDIDLFDMRDKEAYFQVVSVNAYKDRFTNDDFENVKNLTNKFKNVICSRVDGKIVIVICFNEYFSKLSNEIAQEVYNLLSTRGYKEIAIGIGDTQIGYENIATSYNRANIACKHIDIKSAEHILSYKDIEFHNGNGFYYPIETELRILNYIKNSEVQYAKNIMYEVIEKNVNRNNFEEDTQILLRHRLIGTTERIIYEMQDSDMPTLEMASLYESLINANSMDEFKCDLDKFFELIEKYNSEKKIGYKEGLKKRLEDYIECHYHSIGFSLSNMAEEFNVNPSYLSRCFKEYFGENFTSYMAKYKVEKAKSILAETNYSIKEISSLVGYWDVNNFIKTFKRLEGVTPVQYRANKSK